MNNKLRMLSLMLGLLLFVQTGATALTIAPPPRTTYQERYAQFALHVASKYLAEEAQDNQVLSPMSLYLALGMLSEAAEGEALGALLGAMSPGGDRALLKADLQAMWQGIYTREGDTRLVPANSLWFNDRVPLKPGFVEALKADFDADVFSAPFGDPSVARRIHAWGREKTEGLIDLALEPNAGDLMVLLNALYFKDKWQTPFDAADTIEGDFVKADGTVQPQVSYMQRTATWQPYFRGEGYLRADLPLLGGGTVRFVLPDERVKVSQLAGTPELLQAVLTQGEEDAGPVSWQVPRLDMANTLRMNDLLRAAGLGALFDVPAFTRASDTADAVSLVQQDNRIVLTEEHMEAGSITQVVVPMAAPPPDAEPLAMHLNRPFLMAIYAPGGELCFISAVNSGL